MTRVSPPVGDALAPVFATPERVTRPSEPEEAHVQVTAFSTPARPEWRWRIVNYAGETIEESFSEFSSIAAAVANGTTRLTQLNQVDTSRPLTYRSTSHLRAR